MTKETTAVKKVTNSGKPIVARRCLASVLARSARPYSSVLGRDGRVAVPPTPGCPSDVVTALPPHYSVPALYDTTFTPCCCSLEGQHEDDLKETEWFDATQLGEPSYWRF